MYPCGLPFDKSSRANKLLEVLNCSKSSFGCSKFNFQINGADYCIERVGKTSPKRGTTKADVNFLCIVDGATAATHSLNGLYSKISRRIVFLDNRGFFYKILLNIN